MFVTFVSQCEKKALKNTRRVLDSFADRIGNATWQTLITNEGLNAVKKLLRKTASKNTAVACHWARSRNRRELLWIVGNRRKFNSQGIVPVNTTKKDILRSQWENDWHYLPLIKSWIAIAGLFHDWGKSMMHFQAKLRPNSGSQFSGDPLRHEWISCLLFFSIVMMDSDELRLSLKNDEAWLTRLTEGDIDEGHLKKSMKYCANMMASTSSLSLPTLPIGAASIGWLILSHHRLPLIPDTSWSYEPLDSIHELFNCITAEWGYENKRDKETFQSLFFECFEFPEGLPCRSPHWMKQCRKWANKARLTLPLLETSIQNRGIRAVLHHARLCLMIGDYNCSSQPADKQWYTDLNLFANSDRKTGCLKQKLDEHLIGVTKSALHVAHLLPAYEKEAPVVYDVPALKKRSPQAFRWQDKAVGKIKKWRDALPENGHELPFAFFVINMASTGCGKTFANAKVIRALSTDAATLRYVLALGLRTLTLQTGDEYRDRIGLDDTELAVIIGSNAVSALHQKNTEAQGKRERKATESADPTNAHQTDDHQRKELYGNEAIGSESLERFINEEIHFECNIPETGLAAILTDERDRRFLYAPVLACTIDHMMGATETRRGGRYVLPYLRLLSSDLVIDEIDDFCGGDLVAIGRLIHLAGMLGRKVMLSSATIPPELAEGYFNLYRDGWGIYSSLRDASSMIGCAWIDEFRTCVETVSDAVSESARNSYRQYHDAFIDKRVKKLKNEPVKRIGEIIRYEPALLCSASDPKTDEKNESTNKIDSHECHETGEQDQVRDMDDIERRYFGIIQQAIVGKHQYHHTVDEKTGRRVSFGVVRVANISPCIALTEYLIKAQWPEGIDVKVMAYHSRQVLLLRSEQEAHLDEVLKRKEKKGAPPAAFDNPIIRDHLDNGTPPDVIFILVATPVEEVGRDHDFDWAVIEPSSLRAIIQLVGRVLRHRNISPTHANVALMQYNLRALKQGIDRPAYCRPGYEDDDQFKLSTHDLTALLDEDALASTIDAVPRIQGKTTLHPDSRLSDLEHAAIAYLLNRYDQVGPESMQGWIDQTWWMTAMPQFLNPFRKSLPSIRLYLLFKNDDLTFMEKTGQGDFLPVEDVYDITHWNFENEISKDRLWMNRNYLALLKEYKADESGEISKADDISMKKASLRYGEINFPDYGGKRKQYLYSDQLGLKEI